MNERARRFLAAAGLLLATIGIGGCGANDVPVEKSDSGQDTAVASDPGTVVDAIEGDVAAVDVPAPDVASGDAVEAQDVTAADATQADLAPVDPGAAEDPGTPADPGAPDAVGDDDGTPVADAPIEVAEDAQAPGDPGADAVAQSDSDKIAAALAAATKDLWYMSESDYPFEIVLVRGGAETPVTVVNVKDRIASAFGPNEYLCVLAECGVEVLSVNEALDHLIVPEDWWEPYQYEEAEQYKALRDILLNDVHGAQVFRIGDPDQWMGLSGTIELFFIGGSDEGDLVGVSTYVVET